MDPNGKQGRKFLVPTLTFAVGFVLCLCLFYFTDRADSRNRPSDQTSPESTGALSDTPNYETEYISQETAVSIAYANAGVSAGDASLLKVSFDRENGRTVYDIEFQAGALTYDYDINALTGEVLNYNAESKAPQGSQDSGEPAASPETPDATAVPNTEFIGETAAKTAALEHAGFQESDVIYLNVWLDYDDGRPKHYDVEFLVGNTEYKYEIDLYSSTILSQSMENHDTPDIHHSSQHDDGQNGSVAANGTDIGVDAAKDIALNHAQLDASQVTKLKAEYDIDKGIACYEVEFKYNGYEYEYEINAATGEIIKYEIDD